MKKEFMVKQEKTFCDVCGKEIDFITPAMKDFEIIYSRIMMPPKAYSEITARAKYRKTTKDICLNCINKKINEALDELYKK